MLPGYICRSYLSRITRLRATCFADGKQVFQGTEWRRDLNGTRLGLRRWRSASGQNESTIAASLQRRGHAAIAVDDGKTFWLPSPRTHDGTQLRIRDDPTIGLGTNVKDFTPPDSELHQNNTCANSSTHLQQSKDLVAKAPPSKRQRRWKARLSTLQRKLSSSNGCWESQETKNYRLRGLLQHESLEDMQNAWRTLSHEQRQEAWQALVQAALMDCPDKAMLVIKATFSDPLPPNYAIEDVVNHWVSCNSYLTGAEQQLQAEQLCDLVIFILERSPLGYISFRHRSFFRTIEFLSLEKQAELVHVMQRREHRLSPRRLLRFASLFTSDPAYKKAALGIIVSLHEPPRPRVDINDPAWSSICASLLQMSDSKQDLTPAEVLGALLPCGFVPNKIHYTIIIRSLCKAGQLKAAFEILEDMPDHGIKPDVILCTTLLNGAVMNSDVEFFARALKLAEKMTNVDAIFWNQNLTGILHFAMKETSASENGQSFMPPLSQMLRLYSKVFHPEPLQQLLQLDLQHIVDEAADAGRNHNESSFDAQLGPSLESLISAGRTEKLTPRADTLLIMLFGYVKSVTKPYELMSFYASFSRLLNEGDPVAKSLISERDRETFVYDIIVKALCKWPMLVRAALDIASDMLNGAREVQNNGSGPNFANKPRQRTAPSPHPPPSLITWNILIDGFMLNRQTALAERILEMMREHNIRPDIVTWNTLLKGFAKAQDPEGAVRTLRSLESTGFQADSYTNRAVSYLREGKALRLMESLLKDLDEEDEKNRPGDLEWQDEGLSPGGH
jgi:pentatricopeptide repeat protein